MKRVVFDTNFLVDLARFKIDFDEIEEVVEEPYEFFTFSGVVEELERLAEKKSTHARYAKIALALLKRNNIHILKSRQRRTDDILLGFGDKNTIIATNDRVLRKKLKMANVQTICLRAKKHLVIG